MRAFTKCRSMLNTPIKVNDHCGISKEESNSSGGLYKMEIIMLNSMIHNTEVWTSELKTLEWDILNPALSVN